MFAMLLREPRYSNNGASDDLTNESKECMSKPNIASSQASYEIVHLSSIANEDSEKIFDQFPPLMNEVHVDEEPDGVISIATCTSSLKALHHFESSKPDIRSETKDEVSSRPPEQQLFIGGYWLYWVLHLYGAGPMV